MRKTKPTFGILVLAYNRPAFLKRNLELLRANADLSETSVFLSLDGPRDLRDGELVQQCRVEMEHFSNNVPFTSLLVSSTNRGLRNTVLSSVSEAFRSVEHLLVLEDDCLIGESTLSYFNWGFQQLTASENIGAVAGNYLGIPRRNKAFLAQRFNSWGWGSDRGIWQAFFESKYAQLDLLSLLPEVKKIEKTAPRPSRYEYQKISKNLSKLDSWAIPFDLFLRSENLFTIKPTLNQIQNIGFGDMATHTRKGMSLSIEATSMDKAKLELATPEESTRLEKRESWMRFGHLALESTLRADLLRRR